MNDLDSAPEAITFRSDAQLQETKNQDAQLQESKDQDAQLQESKDQDAQLQVTKDQDAQLQETKDQYAQLQESKDQDAQLQESKDQDAQLQDYYVPPTSYTSSDIYTDNMMDKYKYTVAMYKAYLEKKKQLALLSIPGRCVLAAFMGIAFFVAISTLYLFQGTAKYKIIMYFVILIGISIVSKKMGIL